VKSSGWIALGLALTVCERAYGQTHITVEEARQQMLMHTGQVPPPPPLVTPTPEMVHAPSLLFDLDSRKRDFEEGLRLRNAGIELTVVGSALEGVAMFLVFAGAGAGLGGSIGNAFCETFGGGSSGSCPTAWQVAEPYFRGALIVGLVGAVPLGFGIHDLVAGKRKMRKAGGYSVSIVSSVGFASVGATLEF
jgi:hypothetical protein